MRISEGPLTQRQTLIISYLMDGHLHKEIAKKMGVSPEVIRQESVRIMRKMEAKTSAEALTKYAGCIAYRNAAAQLLASRIANPIDKGDLHVNHVLEGIAALLMGWHDAEMPGATT